MTSSAHDSFGCILMQGSTQIGEITNISGPSISRTMHDASTHDGSRWKEYIGGLIDGGTVSVSILYRPGQTDHAGVLALIDATSPTAFRIQWPGGAQIEYGFNAWLSGWNPEGPVDGLLGCSFDLQITGSVSSDTIGASSSSSSTSSG